MVKANADAFAVDVQEELTKLQAEGLTQTQMDDRMNASAESGRIESGGFPDSGRL